MPQRSVIQIVAGALPTTAVRPRRHVLSFLYTEFLSDFRMATLWSESNA